MGRPLISTAEGYTFPEPTKYTAIGKDRADEKYNALGYLIGAIIREDVVTVTAEYDYLPMEVYSQMIRQFLTKYGGSPSRNITYFDEGANNWETREMKLGSKTNGGIIRKDPATGKPLAVIKAKIELTEN